MALSELLLGDNGDQTTSTYVPEVKFKNGDRVQHVQTGSIGTVQDDRSSQYEAYEVPVHWHNRRHGSVVAETKHGLRLL